MDSRSTAGPVSGVVVAAGAGSRLGGQRPKALLEVAGQALVVRAVRVLVAAGVPPPVVVYASGHEAAFRTALENEPVAGLVPGGATRTDSVRAGVGALPVVDGVVAVHDAARPLVPAAVVRRVLAAMADGNVLAAAPALPVADTLKRVDDSQVVGTVDRTGLVAVQTPQAFPLRVLQAVLASDEQATDELALVEHFVAERRLAGSVVVVPGSPLAHKITYQDDLAFLEALAQASDARVAR